MNIVYMGTPDFAVPALEGLINSKHRVLAAVTQPDRMKGRGKKVLPPPVKILAESHGIKVLQPEAVKNNTEFLMELKTLNPDVIVVAAYGRILPKEVLETPKYGCLNIHASLLPKYRGASPMQRAILMGEEKTGVTIMEMAEGLDTGDMILKKEIDVDGMYYPTLSHKLSKIGAEAILEVLEGIEKGTVQKEKQRDEEATYAAIINKEEGRIDFENKSAVEIERMIRAFEPWPGAFSYLGEEESLIKFKAGEALPEKDEWKDASPGKVLRADNDGIFIKAKDSVFKLTELQVPGKNWVDAGSYLRGHKLEIGTVFK